MTTYSVAITHDSLIAATPSLKLYLRLTKMIINANCLVLKPQNTGMTQLE